MDSIFVQEELPLEGLEPAGLRKVFAVWQDGAAGRPFCPRADFRPERLGADIYRIMLVERYPADSHEFRLRLVGAATEYPALGLHGGRFVDEIQPAPYRDYLLHYYRSAFAAPVPAFHRVDGRIEGRDVGYWRLTLPMSLAREHCDLLLIAVHKAPGTFSHSDRINQKTASM
ncbi:MAG TPA: hypothetical protein VE631_01050 [Alphaproteobacteria bacterium]|jgi:hypothetical protein|nr:hypothetical protein [Alphaproteobacteria bacterium]